ncbi:MAG: YggT family protein [Pseudobdellovibrionaceae bacterium]
MGFIAYLLSMLIKGYIFLIIIQVAFSWLIAFKVVDTENQQARNLMALMNKLTDPVMKPIQKYMPPIAGMDLSPLVVIIGLQVIERWVIWPLFAGF